MPRHDIIGLSSGPCVRDLPSTDRFLPTLIGHSSPLPDARPLQLAVPGFIRAWAQAQTQGTLPAMPVLERLVRRGSVSRFAGALPGWHSWQLQLLETLGLMPDRHHASAPLEWLGQGGEPQAGSWLRAEFVHLEMGTRSARLHAIETLDAADAEAFVATLAAHVQSLDFAVRVPPGLQSANHFFLHTARQLEIVCPAPDSEADTDVRELLPQGRDGAALRRLATEAQMLLHDHPANARRERGGLRTVNAIWFSGAGSFAAFEPDPLPAIWANEPYVRGLGRLHESVSQPVPSAVETLVGPGLVFLPLPDAAPPLALKHLEERWFAPLAAGVSDGRLPGLELLLDPWRVSIDRAQLRRFWKRGRSLSAWLT